MNEIDRLYTAWWAGQLSAADSSRLRILLEQPEQRRRWRELADLEGALAEPDRAAAPVVLGQARARRWGPLRLLLAAGVLLALGAGWWFSNLADPDLPRRDGGVVARGAALAGPADLHWRDGTVARLAEGGQVRVPLVGTGLDLMVGELVIAAAPQSAPRRFRVRTPQATAEVVGTRFSVHCVDGLTTLEVDEGTVSFTPVGGSAQAVPAGGRAQAGRLAVPSRGLLAWWPLDDGSGTVARDASGHGHSGQVAGAQWTPEGLHVRGGNDHVAIAATGALASVQAGDYSLTAWFRPEALPPTSDPGEPLESRRDELSVIVGRTGWTLGLHLGADGHVFMQHFLADRTAQSCHADSRVELGRWHHLAGVVDRVRGETRVAVDGVLGRPTRWQTRGAPAFSYAAEQPWRIGISTPDGATCRWPARGLIRNVRLYDRALAEGEIRRLAERP